MNKNEGKTLKSHYDSLDDVNGTGDRYQVVMFECRS